MATECTMWKDSLGVPYDTAEAADAADAQRGLSTFILSANVAGVDEGAAEAMAAALLSTYAVQPLAE